jgi:hypothetical protein
MTYCPWPIACINVTQRAELYQVNQTAIQSALKSIIWDYDVDPGELYEVITGQRSKAGPFRKLGTAPY